MYLHYKIKVCLIHSAYIYGAFTNARHCSEYWGFKGETDMISTFSLLKFTLKNTLTSNKMLWRHRCQIIRIEKGLRDHLLYVINSKMPIIWHVKWATSYNVVRPGSAVGEVVTACTYASDLTQQVSGAWKKIWETMVKDFKDSWWFKIQ